jgi:hypothetical protein
MRGAGKLSLTKTTRSLACFIDRQTRDRLHAVPGIMSERLREGSVSDGSRVSKGQSRVHSEAAWTP